MNRESCPLCELPNVHTRQADVVIRCRHCRLLYFKKVPSELELQDYYAQYTYDTLKVIEPAVLDSIESKLLELKQLTHEQNPVLLDFGCGQGDVLAVAEELGFESYGIEYSQAALKLCRSRGLNVLPFDELTGKRFHIITAFEVIEHLPFPADFFRLMNSILEPGGILYFTTPNSEALSVRFFSETSLLYPEHLTAFSKQAVRVMQRQSNFMLESLITEGIKSKSLLKVRDCVFRGTAARVNQPLYQTAPSVSHLLSSEVSVGGTNEIVSRAKWSLSILAIWAFKLVRRFINIGVDQFSLGETLKVTLRCSTSTKR